MDADLQDPPDVLPDMVAKWREGYDVVLARRTSREGEGWVKRATAHAFYRLIGRLSQVDIPENVGDFRLMDRRVIEALATLPERSRFMKGVFAWLGFPQAVVEYAREPRAAGAAKPNWARLFARADQGNAPVPRAPPEGAGKGIAAWSGKQSTPRVVESLVRPHGRGALPLGADTQHQAAA